MPRRGEKTVMAASKNEDVQDVFEPLVKEGEAELQRSALDISISGLVAGLDIGFGPLAVAVVAGRLHAAFHMSLATAIFLGGFLYPLGFIVVILGKSELFTENTLTPVAGLLAGEGTLGKLAQRWALVLASNVVGTVIFALFIAHTTVVFDPYKAVYRELGLSLVDHSFLQAALAGVLGGWLVALTSWLLKTVQGGAAHLVIIYVITYLLVGLQLYHCIIGSIEVLLAMFAGAPITWLSWLTAFLIPAVTGNAIGGVIFVTGLRGVQSRSGS